MHCIITQTNSNNKEKWTNQLNINIGIQLYNNWMLVKKKLSNK